jgi:hypothetical protein
MAFTIANLSVDLQNGTANFAAFDQASTPPKMVQGTFPFIPGGGEAHERDKVLAAAKAILQQAASEL